jgi:hypothetical protein
MAQRIQRKREKGWRMPEGAIYVGRPSRFGNPYRVGFVYDIDDKPFFVYTRSQAVSLYQRHLTLNPLTDEQLAVLKGKDLACFCPLDEPCHADVLLELVAATGAARGGDE